MPGEVLVVTAEAAARRAGERRSGTGFFQHGDSADSQRMSCHLAHEDRPGHPASLYLENLQPPGGHAH